MRRNYRQFYRNDFDRCECGDDAEKYLIVYLTLPYSTMQVMLVM